MILIKKFELALYNYFLKIELNYDRENHVNFKYMQFSKEDVVLTCSEICSKFEEKYSLKSLLLRKMQYVESPLF